MINKVKKIATVHDLSGVGRCSLTAAIPILSVLGHQPCPFPTAVLSCQTGYKNYSFLDLTDEMKKYKDSWGKMGFVFEGIYTGFLASINQIDIVLDFIISSKESIVFVDPVMGDNGHIYPIYSKEMCKKMCSLVEKADIVAPNLTEALILLDKDYSNLNLSDEEIINIARMVSKLGPKKVVITGVLKGNSICNYGYDKVKDESFIVSSRYNGVSIGGTGDVFSSVVYGMLLKGCSFKKSVKKASDFVLEAIELTVATNSDLKNGVIFEPLLKELINIEI